MNRLMTGLILPLFLLSIASIARAQDAKSREEVLTNETVIAMTKAGFGVPVIVAKIRSSRTDFKLSMADMVTLKQEGVPDAVVEEMLHASPGTGGSAAPSKVKTDPNDPAAAHEAGVYVLKVSDGQQQLIQLEASVYSQAKSGGLFKSAMTYGIAKVKSKAVLAGDHAKAQFDTTRPTFYFYFEVTNSGLSNSGNIWQGASSSPNEFVLVKTEVKKNSRELVVGQMNAFGAQSGALDKYVQAFDYDKIAPGIYKVTPKANLSDGEYCFFYAGSAAMPTYGMASVGSPKVFDFGISVERLK